MSSTTAAANPIRKFSQGRSEIHKIHPTDLTPTDFGDIRKLALSIHRIGIQQALRIRKAKGESILYIVDGERRYKACLLLIQQGKDPGPIPCKLEQQNTTPALRLIHQITLNNGKPFTLLEKARVYRLLKEEHGMNGTQIAEALQTTKQAVSNGLTIITHGSPKLIRMIEKDQLAATTALEIIKTHKHNPQLQDAKALDTLSKTKTSRITPKHLQPEKPTTTTPDTQDTDTPPDTTTTKRDTTKPPDWKAERKAAAATSTGNTSFGTKNPSVDKRHQNIERMLNNLNPDTCHKDRWLTLELACTYLAGESDITPLKKHLQTTQH